MPSVDCARRTTSQELLAPVLAERLQQPISLVTLRRLLSYDERLVDQVQHQADYFRLPNVRVGANDLRPVQRPRIGKDR